jgi:hypothetical protein
MKVSSLILRLLYLPYIYEHILDHKHIAPGTIHAEIALAVSKSDSSIPISETSVSLHFVKPLFLGKNQTVELEVNLSKETMIMSAKHHLRYMDVNEESACRRQFHLVQLIQQYSRCQTSTNF